MTDSTRTTQTIAASFAARLNSVGRDDQGFSNFPECREVVREALNAATSTELPFGDGSVDATVELTFLDGSQLRLSNPRQECFPLQWDILGLPVDNTPQEPAPTADEVRAHWGSTTSQRPCPGGCGNAWNRCSCPEPEWPVHNVVCNVCGAEHTSQDSVCPNCGVS